jgi:hypothetical protein
MSELIRRLNMLLHRRQFDAELEEEMRLHLELRQQENSAAGLSEDEASFAARRRFGNATYLKEESQLAWGWHWLENASKTCDTRHACYGNRQDLVRSQS